MLLCAFFVVLRGIALPDMPEAVKPAGKYNINLPAAGRDSQSITLSGSKRINKLFLLMRVT